VTDTEHTSPDAVIAAPESATPRVVPVLEPVSPPPSVELTPEFRASVLPIVGPALWIFGALLWAYAVIGELIVQLEFPELVGVVIVLAAVARAWFVTVRHLPPKARRSVRALLPVLLALLSWVLFLAIVSMVLGGGGRSEIEAVTLLLWAVGVIAYVFGRRLTRAPAPATARFGRAGAIAAWVLVGGTTVLAVLSIIGHM
jgi:hypothetical protein